MSTFEFLHSIFTGKESLQLLKYHLQVSSGNFQETYTSKPACGRASWKPLGFIDMWILLQILWPQDKPLDRACLHGQSPTGPYMPWLDREASPTRQPAMCQELAPNNAVFRGFTRCSHECGGPAATSSLPQRNIPEQWAEQELWCALCSLLIFGRAPELPQPGTERHCPSPSLLPEAV